MNLFGSRPWYAAGLAFECTQCGKCCAGPVEGYVWLNLEELQALAEFLGKPVKEVQDQCIRFVGSRMTILEERRTKDCIFLTRDAAGRAGCSVYPVRPAQCRTWPFWPRNLRGVDAWCEAARRCQGMNRGPLRDLQEIQDKRDQTHE